MSNDASKRKVNVRRSSPAWSTDLVGVGAAVMCAMIAWLFTVQLADTELIVRRGGELIRISGLAVGLTAAVSAFVGFVALRVLERRSTRALGWWTAAVLIVTLLSFMGPLSATELSAKGTLISLHAVVAAVVIASAQTSRRRR